jgi:hypothetical protein
VALVGFSLFRYGRRYFIEVVSGAGGSATRGTVLYLRSFESDQVSGLSRLSLTSEEEQLLKALRGRGRSLTIGRPGETLPPVGALRIYYDDDEWRDRVQELIRVASAVLIRTGTSDGLHWEVEHVIPCVRPEKLIVAVADDTSLQHFGTGLPHTLVRTRGPFQQTHWRIDQRIFDL